MQIERDIETENELELWVQWQLSKKIWQTLTESKQRKDNHGVPQSKIIALLWYQDHKTTTHKQTAWMYIWTISWDYGTFRPP